MKQKNDSKTVQMRVDNSPYFKNRNVINFQDKEKAVNVKPQLSQKQHHNQDLKLQKVLINEDKNPSDI